MYALIVALIIALTVAIVLVAVILIKKLLTSRKSGIVEIHFLGGANMDDGRMSSDSNYFKGMSDSLKKTVVIGENMRPSSQLGLCVNFYNDTTKESFRFVIDGQLIIGRSTGRGIMTVNDSSVSSTHCVITLRGRKLFLSDLNSTNHTFLNGKQINQNAELFSNDVIKIGNTKLEISF